MTFTFKLKYLAPVALPLAGVALSRLIIYACGVEWTEDTGSFIAAIALIIGVPFGAMLAIAD